MSTPPPVSGKPQPYGSAKDLPTYRELSAKIRFLSRIPDQRAEIEQTRQDLDRLVTVVDAFYDRLGRRNWIFHESLSIDKVDAILTRTTTAVEAENRFIELYRNPDTMFWWITRLTARPGLTQRRHQILRAHDHYLADQFDSCAMQLIAVMDGFVNDFEPDERKGLSARAPEDMTAWDSVVGHHLGLNHAMKAFSRTIKRRIEEEIFEVHRHGIMHGSIVNFDNIVVATKAWNMLFAVADWARATTQAGQAPPPTPTLKTLLPQIVEHARRQQYRKQFVASTLSPSDEGFALHDVVVRANGFLDAWQHRRWGLVALFAPAPRAGKAKQSAVGAKRLLQRHELREYTLVKVTFDVGGGAEIRARVQLDGRCREMTFRMILQNDAGELAIPGDADADWYLAMWMVPSAVELAADERSPSDVEADQPDR